MNEKIEINKMRDKIQIGDKIRVTSGKYEGLTGVVTDKPRRRQYDWTVELENGATPDYKRKEIEKIMNEKRQVREVIRQVIQQELERK